MQGPGAYRQLFPKLWHRERVYLSQSLHLFLVFSLSSSSASPALARHWRRGPSSVARRPGGLTSQAGGPKSFVLLRSAGALRNQPSKGVASPTSPCQPRSFAAEGGGVLPASASGSLGSDSRVDSLNPVASRYPAPRGNGRGPGRSGTCQASPGERTAPLYYASQDAEARPKHSDKLLT